MPIREGELMTIQQAAKAFGLHEQTIRRWYREGKLEPYHYNIKHDKLVKPIRVTPGRPLYVKTAQVQQVYNRLHQKGR